MSNAEERRRLIEDTLALCLHDSTSGSEDAMLPTLRRLLDEMGAIVTTQVVAEGRTNVLARWGDPRVVFTTHLDTVPPFFLPRVDGDLLRGRGTCDAKGQIACQLAAIRRLLSMGKSDVAFLGVVGEETDAAGATAAHTLASSLPNVRLIVNGEPTGLLLATGQRGYMHLRLKTSGRAAHSGMPELGKSAIWPLLDWVDLMREKPCPVDPDLGPEVWNLGILSGGRAANVVPDEAAAEILCRSLPDSDFLKNLRSARPDEGAIEVLLDERAVRYPRIPGFEYAPMPFGSDLPQLATFWPHARVALVGPGSIKVAHTVDEHVAIADLSAGVDLLSRLARTVV
jgi:acetylornithine deacetylase